MKVNFEGIDSVVFLGGGELLRRICKWCLSKEIPLKVLTAPRHAVETHKNSSTFEEFLIENKIDYLVTEQISTENVANFLGNTEKALCVSFGAAWIFKEELIKDLFYGRLLNLHGTRLPQNRGAGGFSWQILMGVRLGFCQLHLIDGGVDTGDIIKTKEYLYTSECRTPWQYEEVFRVQNVAFFTEIIEDILCGQFKAETVSQTEYFSTYWPRLNTNVNGWIDWNQSAEDIERFICAFDDPYPGAKTSFNGEEVHLKTVCLDTSDGHFHPYQSGLIFRKSEKWVCVCAGSKTLIVESVTNADGDDLFEQLRVGDRFMTPMSQLEQSGQRVFYTAKK